VTLHDALSGDGVRGAYYFEEYAGLSSIVRHRSRLQRRLRVTRRSIPRCRLQPTKRRASPPSRSAQPPSKDGGLRPEGAAAGRADSIDRGPDLSRAGWRSHFAAVRSVGRCRGIASPGPPSSRLVYAAALEAGYTKRASTTSREPIATPRGNWLPDRRHAGEPSLDLRKALRSEATRAAIRLLQQVGIPRVVTLASSFGLEGQPAVRRWIG